jgi:multicomponent Na+:H+ antiporter subunit B
MTFQDFFAIPQRIDFSYVNVMLGIVLLLLMLVLYEILRSKNLLKIVIVSAILSSLISICYLLLDAPDVAMTEVALNAALSTCIFLNVFKHVGFNDDELVESASSSRRAIAIILSSALFYLLFLAWQQFPEFGSTEQPSYLSVKEHYLDQVDGQIGIPSIVASILASYRGFDTLGETAVILIAGIGVASLLQNKDYLSVNESSSSNDSAKEKKKLHEIFDTPMLQKIVPLLVPYMILYAFYVQFNGKTSPGGGFQAGVILATAIILTDMISLGKIDLFSQKISADKLVKIGAFGVFIYAFAGILTMFSGGDYLEYNALFVDKLKGQYVGILMIETGVGITVSSIMGLLYSLTKSTNMEQI